ncbi:MAG: hypothetical protein R2771_02305 [Saprospiraceae bacterium]
MASGNFFHHSFDVFGVSLHPVSSDDDSWYSIRHWQNHLFRLDFLEFFSLQAPKEKKDCILVLAHLHSFVSSLVGFIMSGYLLNKYCPDPKLFSSHTEWKCKHPLINIYGIILLEISILAALSLLIYGKITSNLDKKLNNQ